MMKLTMGTALSSLLLLSACVKEPELKPDFGPEVSTAEFAKLLNEIEQPDPYTIKKDEYAYFIRSTNIADQIYQIDKRWAYTVTNKADVGNDFVFTYVREQREYDEKGQEKISQDQDQVSLAKPGTMTQTGALAVPPAILPARQSPPTDMSPFIHGWVSNATRSFLPSSDKTADGLRPKSTRYSFHNAKLETTQVAVPDFVRQRTDCGGLSAEKCRGALKAFVMSYDQVVWDGEEGQRYSVRWVFSPDVPFFGSTMFPNPAGVIQSCSSTQMPYQGSRIKITQCDEIKDFTFGQ